MSGSSSVNASQYAYLVAAQAAAAALTPPVKVELIDGIIQDVPSPELRHLSGDSRKKIIEAPIT